jgi:hypothetical protein
MPRAEPADRPTPPPDFGANRCPECGAVLRDGKDAERDTPACPSDLCAREERAPR